MPSKLVALGGAALAGAAVSFGITSTMIGGIDHPSVKSAIVGAGLAGMLLGPAILGYQLEEETNRRVDMTPTVRRIWFAIGVAAVLLNAFLAPVWSGLFLSDS